MFELTVKSKFAAAHYLRNYQGKCARMHGHTWLVEVVVSGAKLNQHGMLVDFKHIKSFLQSIINELDHQNLNNIEPFLQNDKINPTAECLAKYIFKMLKIKLHDPEQAVTIKAVRVWESDDAGASYHEEE